jgi:hypothetical protein
MGLWPPHRRRARALAAREGKVPVEEKRPALPLSSPRGHAPRSVEAKMRSRRFPLTPTSRASGSPAKMPGYTRAGRFLDAQRTKDYRPATSPGLAAFRSGATWIANRHLNEGRDSESVVSTFRRRLRGLHMLAQKLFGAGFNNLLVQNTARLGERRGRARPGPKSDWTERPASPWLTPVSRSLRAIFIAAALPRSPTRPRSPACSTTTARPGRFLNLIAHLPWLELRGDSPRPGNLEATAAINGRAPRPAFIFGSRQSPPPTRSAACDSAPVSRPRRLSTPKIVLQGLRSAPSGGTDPLGRAPRGSRKLSKTQPDATPRFPVKSAVPTYAAAAQPHGSTPEGLEGA